MKQKDVFTTKDERQVTSIHCGISKEDSSYVGSSQAGDAAPDIQLAGFDDFFRLANSCPVQTFIALYSVRISWLAGRTGVW